MITNNPNVAKSLLSIGEYKGYGLASMIEFCVQYFWAWILEKIFLLCLKVACQKKKIRTILHGFKIRCFCKKLFLKNLDKMYREIKKQKKRK